MDIDSFQRPYAEAGHDVASLFDVKTSNKCKDCGAYLIDLAEDMVFGDLRPCLPREPKP